MRRFPMSADRKAAKTAANNMEDRLLQAIFGRKPTELDRRVLRKFMEDCNDPRRGRTCWYVPDVGAYYEGLGFRLSIVNEFERSHTPNGTWPYHGHVGETLPYAQPTIELAKEMATRLNERLGLTERDCYEIVARSMFGRGFTAPAGARL
jgi:hypothetical protein